MTSWAVGGAIWKETWMLKQSLIIAGTIGWIAVAAISSGIDRTAARKKAMAKEKR